MNKHETVVAVINSSEDTVDMLREVLQHNGFTAVVTAHVDDIKRGRLDFPEFVRKHNPRVFIYDVSIPYVENWRALELLMKTDVMRSRRVVVTTTNKRALDQLLGERTDAIEIIGKPYDLDVVVKAVEAAATEMPAGSDG
jgi:DNA-binding NarL/FixJ family response regulator